MKTRLNLKTETHTHLHIRAAQPSSLSLLSLEGKPPLPPGSLTLRARDPESRPSSACQGWGGGRRAGVWTRASRLGTGTKLEDGGSVSLREIW